MRSLLLDPHGDDAFLFAYFTLRRERPHVVTVLRSFLQGQRGIPVTAEEREHEQRRAIIESTDCTWEQWPYRDDRPAWGFIEQRIASLVPFYDVCFAPLPEPGGHDHHNIVGEIAREAFGPKCQHYLTYTVDGKSVGPYRVDPEPGWINAKLRALAEFYSQTRHPETGTGEHFLRGLHEYLA